MTTVLTPWNAPAADEPVRATVRVSGSKSLTNRALLLAALADGPSTIRRPLRSRDTELMAAAVRTLGAVIDVVSPGGVVARDPINRRPVTDAAGSWHVRPAAAAAGTGRRAAVARAAASSAVGPPDGGAGTGRPSGPLAVDCGLAGTVMRFVPPAAALVGGEVRFYGDARARERPMGEMLGALRGLGVRVTGDALPFVVHGAGRVAGGPVTLDASASSQFVSGLLLAGARYERGVLVRHRGPAGHAVPSLPHIEMTVHMLREHGVEVRADPAAATWLVEPGPIRARDWEIEPDLSNAAVYLAAAAATGGAVTVPGWPAATTQAGDAIRGILAAMGCTVRFHPNEAAADGVGRHGHGGDHGYGGGGGRGGEGLDSGGNAAGERALTVVGPPRGSLRGVDLDLHDVSELTPTVAALAALADGPSTLRGVAHLRGHETDRLAALAAELSGLGGSVEETVDGLRIRPRPLRGGSWRAYADHRMATAGAIIGLVVPGVVIDDVGCTGKTIPDFPAVWRRMLAQPQVQSQSGSEASEAS